MIYFVGAGPGDPRLITVKGKELLEQADVVVYAGSLVNPQLLEWCPSQARIFNSASMCLEEIVGVLEAAHRAGETAVRLHTGDPSLYGAVREQMDALDREGIPYQVVPGVSSFLAAAASLRKEYTLPGVTQTVILTRLEGRTAVPEREEIRSLAAHQATMAVFLSAGQIERLCALLMEEYPPDTPAAVVYKASWQDETIARRPLRDLAREAREAGIHRTALILAGDFLGDSYELSRLYDRSFSHGYRRAQEPGGTEGHVGGPGEGNPGCREDGGMAHG